VTFRVIAPGTLALERPSPRFSPEPSGQDLARLLRAVGPAYAAELRNLLEESQPELRTEGLLALAEELLRRDHPSAAAELFNLMASEHASPEVSRARQRLEAMQGRGPLDQRLELLGRSFMARATDPAMIASFGLAGAVANAVRLSVAGTLVTRSATCWTRGFGLRLASGFAAYAAEVPTLVATRRSFASVAGAEGEGPSLSQELSSTALFLGVMQLSGFTGGAASRAFRPNPIRTELWNSTVNLGGVYLARRLEEGMGLRHTASSEADRWVDVADTWLQMRVGARLLQGAGHAEDYELRRERLLQVGLRESLAERPSSISAMAEEITAPALPAGFMNREEDPRLKNYASDPELQALAAAWGEELAQPGTLRAVMKIGLELESLGPVVNLLKETSLRDPVRLEVSLNRLAFMIEHSRPRGVRGNYTEWLVRLAFASALRQNTRDIRENPLQVTSILHVDNLLDRLYDGSPLNKLEELLYPLFPQYRMRPIQPNRLQRLGQAIHARFSDKGIPSRIASLPQLGVPARDTLMQLNQHAGRLNKEDLLYREMGQFMGSFERATREREDLIPDIERAIAAASHSPLSYLRLYRLSRICEAQLWTYPKVLELGEPGVRVQGFSERTRNPMTAEAIDQTQDNGFYEEPNMAENFAQFFRRMEDYLVPAQRLRRAERRRTLLGRIWQSPRSFNVSDVLRAFDSLGDYLSVEAATAIRNGDVSLEILDDEAFNAEVDKWVSDQVGHRFVATMVPGRNGERNRILVRQLHPASLSPEVFQDFIFRRLGYIIHEYEHHVHTDPALEHREALEILRQEMRATHRQIHWNAEHGDTRQLEQFTAEGATGWAMFLRSWAEGIYLRYKNPED